MLKSVECHLFVSTYHGCVTAGIPLCITLVNFASVDPSGISILHFIIKNVVRCLLDCVCVRDAMLLTT